MEENLRIRGDDELRPSEPLIINIFSLGYDINLSSSITRF